MRKFLSSTGFLTNGLIAIGGVIMIGGAIILRQIFNGRAPDIYIYFVLIISFSFFSLGCLFIILRKEAPRPGLSSTKGWVAVVGGLIGLLMFGGAALYILISLLLSIY